MEIKWLLLALLGVGGTVGGCCHCWVVCGGWFLAAFGVQVLLFVQILPSLQNWKGATP